eukprot:gene9120-biopygen13734
MPCCACCGSSSTVRHCGGRARTRACGVPARTRRPRNRGRARHPTSLLIWPALPADPSLILTESAPPAICPPLGCSGAGVSARLRGTCDGEGGPLYMKAIIPGHNATDVAMGLRS